MNSVRIKGTHIVLQFLLLLVVLFQFVQISFVHYHTSTDGRVFAHAHPYNTEDKNDSGNSGSNHNHSNKEIAFFQLFDGLFLNNAEFMNLNSLIVDFPKEQNSTYQSVFTSVEYLNQTLLRGPPCS